VKTAESFFFFAIHEPFLDRQSSCTFAGGNFLRSLSHIKRNMTSAAG